MIRALTAIVVLLFMSCTSDVYAGKGTAWFYTSDPFATAEDYDVWVSNPQRNWDVWPPFDSDQKRIAYHNCETALPNDNAILRQFRAQFSGDLLTDGGDPEAYVLDPTYGSIYFRFDDVTLGRRYAEWIINQNYDLEGIYLDQCFDDGGFPNGTQDSLTKYMGADSATVVAQFGAYRDSLIVNLRRGLDDKAIIIANCGWPPLEDSNLSGITIETGHMTSQARIDSTENVFRRYITARDGFHNVAWSWSSFYAHDGTIE